MRIAALILAAAALAPAKMGSGPSGLAIGFICGAEQAPAGTGPRTLIKTAGVGNSHMTIRTANPEAQAWFDYGLQLADGFYHEDAKAAFARAQSLDPTCAMCAWGEAWARGTTLNFDVSAAETAAALALTEKAEKLAVDERERALIAALKLRDQPAKGGVSGDKAFAQAMDALVRRYPADDQIAVIASHALLIPAGRNDRTTVERAVQVLAAVLARNPDHVGAIHFYIHAIEVAGRPELALPYAERLPGLAPAASHLVHMPSHTLLRMGRYQEAALRNAQALDVEARYRQALNAPGALGTAAYYAHNLQFGLAGAMLAGDADLALKFAAHAPVAYPASVTTDQKDYVLGRSYVAYGRFDPDRAMAIAEPAKEKTVLRIMRHYARGEAAAGRGDIAAVRQEAKLLGEVAAPAGPSQNMSRIARLVLEGRAGMLSGDLDDAVRAYSEAADLQDDKLRDRMDPPPWWYPVRRSLAAALLKQGRFADAAAEARRSLAGWPNDALALRVLGEAQRQLGRQGDARRLQAQARRAWQGDPERLPLAMI